MAKQERISWQTQDRIQAGHYKPSGIEGLISEHISLDNGIQIVYNTDPKDARELLVLTRLGEYKGLIIEYAKIAFLDEVKEPLGPNQDEIISQVNGTTEFGIEQISIMQKLPLVNTDEKNERYYYHGDKATFRFRKGIFIEYKQAPAIFEFGYSSNTQESYTDLIPKIFKALKSLK